MSNNLRPLTPSDVENYMLSILPHSVPPEFVAQAVVLLAPLRVSVKHAEQRMLDILGCAHGHERMWVTAPSPSWAFAELRTVQGWKPVAYWSKNNLRAYIDETIAVLFPDDA